MSLIILKLISLGLASGYRFNDSNQKVLRDYEIGYVKEGCWGWCLIVTRSN